MKFQNVLATAVALATFAGHSYAAESATGYFGLSFGQADVKDLCDSALDSCDDTAFTGRIHGGVHLNRYVDLEFGYRYVDHVDASFGLLEAEADGHFVDATLHLGTPRTESFQVFAKAGAMYWLVDYKVSAPAFGVSASDDEDGMAFRTGIGARYNLNESISLRADWDYLVDVGNSDLGESDIQIFSFGPEVRF